MCTYVLDKHAPQKKRYLRSHHKLFMNNEISKATMTRTRLRNRFLNEKQITNNKRFWKTVKPLLSNKVQSSEKINLTEVNDSLIRDCRKVAKELNSFFSSVVKNLNIPSYESCDPLSDNIDHPTMKGIVKWRNYPSIVTITSQHKNTSKFSLILFRKNMLLKKYKCWTLKKLSKKVIFPLS